MLRIISKTACLSNKSGRSYVEVLIAMALLSIMIIPLFPALAQARDNQYYAILRHQAHSQAVAIVAEIRSALYHGTEIPFNGILGTAQKHNFIYRITIYSAGNTPPSIHIIGETFQVQLPPPLEIELSTHIAGIETIVIVVEVFRESSGASNEGNLLGKSVGMLPRLSRI